MLYKYFSLFIFLFIFSAGNLKAQRSSSLPDILYIEPSTVYQNQSYNLYLSTQNFDASRMVVSFGDGITVNSLTCSSPYSCNANISVSQNASLGMRDVVIYYIDRPITATAKITVQQAQLPDIVSINPSTLFQGNSYDLSLNTINFDSKSMYLDFGSGININSIGCSGRNYCSANVSISIDAQIGLRDVKIIYGNQTIIATAKVSIEKEPQPDILSVNPSNLNQGKTYDLSLQVTNYDPYKMSLDFGSGTKINGLTCPSKYSCICNMSILPDAEPGMRDIKIQFKEKILIATAKITIISEQPPDVLSSNPSVLEKGQSYNLNLNTINFDSKTMQLDFGSGIEVISLSCTSPYNCTSNVSVLSNAQSGVRDIKIKEREKTYTTTAKITIEEEKLPDVLSSNPSILEKGKNYNLNLGTINFDPKAMQLNFGSGITANSLSCTSPYSCLANVSVSNNAQAGIKDIKINYKGKVIIATAKITIEEEKLPDVLSANPSSLYQGENYALTLNTVNFDQRKMALSFGDGIEAQNLNCPSTSFCNLNLKISQSAKTGIRDVKIIYKEKEIIATAKLNILEEQMPDILSSNPSNLIQGENYNLNLITLRFEHKKMGLDFGDEIKLNSFSCQSTSLCNANISVLSSAKPGLKDIYVIYKEKRIPATAKILISEAQEPDIIAANPTSIERGKEYNISLNTINFDIKSMQIDIGAGFEIKKFNCIDKFNCFLDLKVQKDAKTGKRDIYIYYKNKKKVAQAKLNVEKELSGPILSQPITVIPQFQCDEKNYKRFEKAKINLLEPEIYFPTDYAFVKEGSLFKWKEINPGLAEWFEFRILWNDKVIWKKKIEAMRFTFKGKEIKYLPTFFKVDSDFLNEMANTDWKSITSSSQGGMVLNTVHGVILQWQVAGIKNYPVSCIFGDLGPKVELEVEISDKWNFALPDKSTGLECSNAKTAPGIKIQNLDIGKGQKYGDIGTQNFPQDRIEISGFFNLSNSPYIADALAFFNAFVITNLIVDWGDGEANYIFVKFQNYGMEKSEALNKVPLEIIPQVHKYSNVGKWKIRVFMVSEEDLQDIDPLTIVSAYENFSYNPYWKAVSYKYNKGATSKLQEIASKAYMIYCTEIEISPVEDLVAKGPLHLESVSIDSYNGEKIPPSMFSAPRNFSNCQKLQPGASLKYYGKGNTSVKWYLNDILINEEWPVLVGPSKPRKNLTRENYSKPTSDSYDLKEIFLSPPIDLEKLDIKNYQIKVEVQVGLEEYFALTQGAFAELYEDFLANYNSASMYASVSPNYYLGETTSSFFAGISGEYGFLSPSQEASGFPPYISSDISAPYFPEIPEEKPYYVEDYDIVKVSHSNSEIPCKFIFNTKSGDFFYVDVYNKVKKDKNGKFYGTGNIIIKLYKGSGFYFEKILKVNIDGWEVDEKGIVLKGEINETLLDQIEAIGMKIKLEKITAKAKEEDLELTLSILPLDTTLRIAGKTEPPEWINKKSRLDGEGNWYWEGQEVKEISLSSSGFRLILKSVKIDLSSKEGEGIDPSCGGGTGTEWAGINFSNLKIIPYTFDLNNEKNLPYEKSVDNWGIVSGGLCGKVQLPEFYSKFKKGSISFQKIEASSKGGNFKAIYKNMDIFVPWLQIHLKGDGKFVPGGGEVLSHIDLTGLVSDKLSVKKDYGNISFTAKNFKFGSLINVGWATRADVYFDFKAKGIYFVKNVPIPDIYFDMDYRAYFGEGISSKEAQVGKSSSLGKSPVFIKNMILKIPNSGSEIFNISFTTSFSISKKLPTVDAPVLYSLKKDPGNNFKSTGPKVLPFEVVVLFPQGNPEVKSKIKVEYNESSSLANFGVYENYLASKRGLDSLLFLPSGPEDYFKGEVDLSMIGAPVKAKFRLGYWGDDDYWIVKADIDLGVGIQVGMLPLKLYKIRGGLGYNFPLDAFGSPQGIFNIQPKIDGSYLFMAGIRIGTTDKKTFVADGDFTMKIGNGGARLDFKAWILKEYQSGEGDVKGFFQYAGGSFDGMMWTPKPFIIIPPDYIWVNIPKDSTTVHFGSDYWIITAGKKEGPRLQGHIIIADASAYFMLGSKVGYQIGGTIEAEAKAGNCSDVCAWASAYVEASLGLNISPLQVKGDFGAGAEVGACAYIEILGEDVGGCMSVGLNIAVHIEAPSPVVYWIKFSLNPPIPCLDSIDVYIGIIPPSFDPDLEWCV